MTDFRLRKLSSFAGVKGPVLVCVMDGVGIGARDEADAVWLARTPNARSARAAARASRALTRARHRGRHAERRRHGQQRGRPQRARRRPDLRSGREAGRRARSRAARCSQGEAWQRARRRAACATRQPLHFLGLLSDGNVHSPHRPPDRDAARAPPRAGVQARARARRCSTAATCRETSALDYVDALEAVLAELRAARRRLPHRLGRRPHDDHDGPLRGRLARWSSAAGSTHVLGDGAAVPQRARGDRDAARRAPGRHRSGPAGVRDRRRARQPVGPIRDGDAVVLFNFRGDRAIEISRAFEDDEFAEFDRVRRPDVLFAGMMEYDGDLHMPEALPGRAAGDRAHDGRVPGAHGVRQLAISETQKFGHVTYFWNGNRSGMFDDAARDLRRDPERPRAVRAAAVDEGGRDHRRADRASCDRAATASRASTTPTATWSATPATSTPTVHRGRGRRPAARPPAAGDRAAAAASLIVTADHGNADEMFERDKTRAHPASTPTGGRARRPATRSTRCRSTSTRRARPTCASTSASRGRPWRTSRRRCCSCSGFEAPGDYEPGLLKV